MSEPINLGEGTPNAYYAIFQVADRKQPADVDFATLKPTIETDYKMAQVAKEEVKKGTGNPPFDETLKTTRAALRQQNQQQSPGAPAPAPSLRDVLTYILLPLQRNTLSDLKTKGTVKVDDPNYASVADQYKPAPHARRARRHCQRRDVQRRHRSGDQFGDGARARRHQRRARWQRRARRHQRRTRARWQRRARRAVNFGAATPTAVRCQSNGCCFKSSS